MLGERNGTCRRDYRAKVGMHGDTEIRIAMVYSQEMSADCNGSPQLFGNLTNKCGGMIFTRLDLATGEFPLVGDVRPRARAALDAQDGSLHLDNGRDHTKMFDLSYRHRGRTPEWQLPGRAPLASTDEVATSAQIPNCGLVCCQTLIWNPRSPTKRNRPQSTAQIPPPPRAAQSREG